VHKLAHQLGWQLVQQLVCRLVPQLAAGAGGHSGTTASCGQRGCPPTSNRCWGAPLGPKGFSQVALHLLSTPVVCTMAKWHCAATGGQGGTAALLPVVATLGGGAKVAGVGVTL